MPNTKKPSPYKGGKSGPKSGGRAGGDAPKTRSPKARTPTRSPRPASSEGKPDPRTTPNRPAPRGKPKVMAEPAEFPLVDIISMVSGGYGVAQINDHPVYLPYTIEGERVTASLMPPQRGIYYGEGIQLVGASRDRVGAECVHFGTCWGCQWQHIAYDAQLLIKFDILAEQIQRHKVFTDTLLEPILQPVIASPQQWGYLHQATFQRIANTEYGFQTRTDAFTPVPDCRTMHPDLVALYGSLDIDFEGMKAFSLHRGDAGETMMVLHMLNEDMPELDADFPTSVNVLLPDREPMNLFGESLVQYRVRERLFRVTAGSFFRANVAQLDALVGEVLFALALTGIEHVLDCYAGVGVFSAFIAPHAAVVTVIESYPPAATDADENLADFDNVDIVEGSVAEILEDMRDTDAHYDAILLDPPARGIGEEDLKAVLALRAARLVYVSSNAVSFAKDAVALMAAGYRPTRIQPLDSAPHTYYADLVATFVR